MSAGFADEIEGAADLNGYGFMPQRELFAETQAARLFSFVGLEQAAVPAADRERAVVTGIV